MQDAPLHHPQCSSLAVHRHLGARGISCTELHRAPRCRWTSLHRHRRCERPAPSPGTVGAVDASMKRSKALEQLKARQTVWSCDARVMGCDFQTLSHC